MRSNSMGCRRSPEHFSQQKSGLAPTRMCDRLRTKIQYSGRELQKQGTDGKPAVYFEAKCQGLTKFIQTIPQPQNRSLPIPKTNLPSKLRSVCSCKIAAVRSTVVRLPAVRAIRITA